jgi:hypothetical protein
MVAENPKSNPDITEIVVTAEMDNKTRAVTLKSVTFDGASGTTTPTPATPTVLLHVDVIDGPKGGGGGVCVTSGGVTVCR